MSASFFGYAANPANGGDVRDGAIPVAITPPAAMLEGDLVYVEVTQRDPGATLSIAEDGGQTWNAIAPYSSGSQRKRTFWCVYNGTWEANPSWTTSFQAGLHFSVQMLVFRPSGTPTWAVDVVQASGYAVPSSPFDVTATGQTATDSGVTIATWFNTGYDGEPFTLQTGGWSNPGGVAQFRNTKASPTGNEQSISIAYKLNSGAGATGNVANRVTQAVTTLWTVITFKDQSSAAPSPTDVDTDEIILGGQVDVVVTGSNFGASQGAGSVTLRQGSVAVTQTIDSWAAASIQFDTVFETAGADLKHGAASLRVTDNGGAYGSIAITIHPPAGHLYVDLISIAAAGALEALPTLVAGDQLQVRGVGGGAAPAGLFVNADGAYGFLSGYTPTAFEFRVWAASDQTWGAWATVEPTDTVPAAFDFVDQVGQELSVITESAQITVSGINAPAPIIVANGEMRIDAGPWIGGQSSIAPGHTLQLRHATANTADTLVVTTVTIGGLAADWSTRTKALPPEEEQESPPTELPPTDSPRPTTIEEAFVIDYGGTPDDIPIRLRRRQPRS